MARFTGLSLGIAMTLALHLGARPTHACVDTGCIEIWSTEPDGGALTVYWDFSKPIQTYLAFCTPDKSLCLFSTIDAGFMAPTDTPPAPGLYQIDNGVSVSVVIVNADAGFDMEVNGQKLSQPGDTALLGTMPPIHNHPAWQIIAPPTELGNFAVSYKLTSSDPRYADSSTYTQLVTNVPPPMMTPTVTPTPLPPACPGDCDVSGKVTINEVVKCVNIALGLFPLDTCLACDANLDGGVSIDEIITGANDALAGCPAESPATLTGIQSTIFTPSCAIANCHDAQSGAEGLVLTEGQSYGQLVNVPSNEVMSGPGALRVDPGNPDNSFLVIKVTGPPPGEGSVMPLNGARLTAQQIQLIRNWIMQGAPAP